MHPPPAISNEGIIYSGRPAGPTSVCCPSITVQLRVRLNVAQMFIMWVGNAEKFLKVRGQRSRSYLYICVHAITVEAHISMVWRWGSLVFVNVRYNFKMRQNLIAHYSYIWTKFQQAFEQFSTSYILLYTTLLELEGTYVALSISYPKHINIPVYRQRG